MEPSLIEPHYLSAFGAVILTAISHILLKTAATRNSGVRLWLNARAITAYVLMFATTLMSLYAFRVVPLRANVVIAPLVLLGVAVLSVTTLGEHLTKRQIFGCAVILAGIAVYNV